MSLNVELRCLAQAEPHEPVVLGPEPLVPDYAAAGLQGDYSILGSRRGLTISGFDFIPEEITGNPMRSAPCVALNILFEGSGHSWLEDESGRSGEIPFRPAFYCMIAPQGASGFDAIRPGARFRGVDIRMTPEIWRSLGGPGLEQIGGAENPLHIASTGRVWTGILPLSPAVRRLADSLMGSITSGGSDLNSEARALDIIAAAIGLLGQPNETGAAQLMRRDLRAIRSIIAMMEADLARPWQLAELAQAAGIGMKRLKQHFPKETGLPVYAWLQEARLQKAHQMLTGTEAPRVTEVSLAVGYSSLSHFSALFRRRFGLSPSALRVTPPGAPL